MTEEIKNEEEIIKNDESQEGVEEIEKDLKEVTIKGEKKEEEEIDIDLNDPEVEAAAVKIQSAFSKKKAK